MSVMRQKIASIILPAMGATGIMAVLHIETPQGDINVWAVVSVITSLVACIAVADKYQKD